VLLKERPIAARSVLGLLNYKPQFGALIRSYWREWGAGVQWLAWRLISICRADIARAYRGGRVHGCSSCHPLESRPRPYISGASHRALGHLRHGPWVQDLQSNGSGNTVVYFYSSYRSGDGALRLCCLGGTCHNLLLGAHLWAHAHSAQNRQRISPHRKRLNAVFELQGKAKTNRLVNKAGKFTIRPR
jgi:hypothetical protein